MFTQPSVNQIASAYQGNPAPLSAKVDQDKKQNGGIPQDLRQLMALNDIAEGRGAAANQQALNVPTNMPTIAQSLQERARQALQARMMQQQQEQQRKNGMPMMVPQGTPRPPMQPQAQGLDSLQSNVGQGYADGGIIRFATPDLNQVVPEPEEETSSTLGNIFKSITNPIAKYVAENYKNQRERSKIAEELMALKPGLLEQLTGSQRAERERKTNLLKAQLEGAGSVKETYPATGKAENLRPYGQSDAERELEMMLRKTPASLEAERAAPKFIPPKPAQNVNIPGGGAPSAPPKPATSSSTSILDELKNAGLLNLPIDDSARKNLQAQMNLKPEDQERLAIEKFKQQVGDRDLSVYDRMAAELEARKERLNAPKPGIEGLLDYLSFVAQSGGRTRGEAGAKAAAAMQARNLSRQEQQSGLMEKILELGQKKSEAEYGQKEKMYGIGQERYKEVYKNAHDAAKALFKSDEDARNLGLEAVMKQKQMDTQLAVAKMNQASGGGSRDNLMERAAVIRRENPGMTVEESMKRAALAAGASSVLGSETKDKAKGMEEYRKLEDAYKYNTIGNSEFAKRNREAYNRQLGVLQSLYGPLDVGASAVPSGAKTTGQVKFLGYEK
jgi:hypothetical protein